jgi:uncharacterized protein
MTHFTRDPPRDGNYIDSCEPGLLRINGRAYRQSLWLTPERLAPWAPTSFEQLDEALLEPLLTTTADLVLIGSGTRQRFLSMALLTPFYRRGIGVEVMNSCAACRTFNLLTAEGRRPLAGIILEGVQTVPVPVI